MLSEHVFFCKLRAVLDDAVTRGPGEYPARPVQYAGAEHAAPLAEEVVVPSSQQPLEHQEMDQFRCSVARACKAEN